MIISGKGVNRINETEDALINTTDLLSTIAEITGVNETEINDSKSFKALHESASTPKTDYVLY